MMQNDDDQQLRSALKRLAPSVHEGQALERVMRGGRSVRRRHRYQVGGIAVLVVLLAAFGAAGIWWLARDLPANPADQLPFLAESWPAADSASEPLTALPVLSLQEMREVDVSGPGGWTLALDPEKDAGTIAEILTAYGQMTLTPEPEGGFTYPAQAPDVTMALVPLEGQPLYVGMLAVMSSVSLEVWTPGAQGTALRGWISGEPLHALFRNYWGLANEAASTASIPSTTSTSATGPTGTVQPPPAAELDNIVVLFKKVGIEAPSVSYFALDSPAGSILTYDIALPKVDVGEATLREDRATRALALAKQRGELTLDWVAFRAPGEAFGLGGVRQVSKLDPAFVSADPSATLADSRTTLLPAVDKLTTDQGLVLVSASVIVDQTTQLLSVHITAPSGTAQKELTGFAQAVGVLVDTLNAKQAQVGVSHVWATDPDGKTLGVELHDFAIGLDAWYPADAAS